MLIRDQRLGRIINTLTALHGGNLWGAILTRAGCCIWISLLQPRTTEDLFLQGIFSRACLRDKEPSVQPGQLKKSGTPKELFIYPKGHRILIGTQDNVIGW